MSSTTPVALRQRLLLREAPGPAPDIAPRPAPAPDYDAVLNDTSGAKGAAEYPAGESPWSDDLSVAAQAAHGLMAQHYSLRSHLADDPDLAKGYAIAAEQSRKAQQDALNSMSIAGQQAQTAPGMLGRRHTGATLRVGDRGYRDRAVDRGGCGGRAGRAGRRDSSDLGLWRVRVHQPSHRRYRPHDTGRRRRETEVGQPRLRHGAGIHVAARRQVMAVEQDHCRRRRDAQERPDRHGAGCSRRRRGGGGEAWYRACREGGSQRQADGQFSPNCQGRGARRR